MGCSSVIHADSDLILGTNEFTDKLKNIKEKAQFFFGNIFMARFSIHFLVTLVILCFFVLFGVFR